MIRRTVSWILAAAVMAVAGLMALRLCNAGEMYANTMPALHVRAGEALSYCKAKKLNTEYCILVDFSIHSGRNRLFVWDFARDTIAFASLCAHGYGMGSTASKPIFSNEPESHCSSLGHYRTGIRSYSKWGINVHYKLHGLDTTNSNAFKRDVVLHSYGPVPEVEIYPLHLPMGYSAGCPVVSDNAMRRIDSLLKAAKTPMLLWIYELSVSKYPEH